MKGDSIASLLIATLVCAMQPAPATANPAIARLHAASFERTHRVRQTQRPATISQEDVTGVIPRAIRGGNPLQMLNPLAPPKYGTAEENVSLDPDAPGKANGINFLTISF